MSGEKADERWSPAQRVESVLVSILSLLDDAECSSPANVEAGVMLRDNPARYRELVLRDVDASRAMIPPGFEMPTQDMITHEVEKVEKDDLDFWMESDADSDPFGGSDSDEDQDADDFDGDLDMDQVSGSDDDDDTNEE